MKVVGAAERICRKTLNSKTLKKKSFSETSVLMHCKDCDLVVSFGNHDTVNSFNSTDSRVVNSEHFLEEITEGGNTCYGDD